MRARSVLTQLTPILLLVLPSAATAAPSRSQVRLPDPSYYRRPHAKQKRQLTPLIRLLAHPTTGAPALVTAGDALAIWIGAPLAPPATGLQVHLSTTVANRTLTLRLPVIGLDRRPGEHLTVVSCRVPSTLPRETFDLTVQVPGQTETQRRAVRVRHRTGGSLRIALLADHQLWDPSVSVKTGRRNAGSYPTRGERREHRAMARQGLHELRLLDPDLVIHLGDLIFGLDFEKEYQDALALWRDAGLAAFMVPGNHDGYARYGINLKASLPRLAVGLVKCRAHLPRKLDVASVWRYLSCVYGDLKPVLFSTLLSDGLVSWRKKVGPTHYAYDLGRYRLIALNTYDGTAERRHAFSIWVNIKGLHLGAPMVDNYGGYLSVAQLRWLERELLGASRAGRTPVVVGHHDPRGNPTGAPYHANQPFPTDPVGPDHFEAWNFDERWDSDPTDLRGRESATNHSGHQLLRLLAKHGGYYLSGHVHQDAQRSYRAGELLAPGIPAQKPVTFIKVTTASAAPKGVGYWGYRLLTARADGTLETSPFSVTPPLPSVPAGNFWATRHDAPDAKGGRIFALHTGLPQPVKLRLRALLPHRPQGYTFSTHTHGATVDLMDVAPLSDSKTNAGSKSKTAAETTTTTTTATTAATTAATGEAIYYLDVTLPAAGNDVARQPADVRVSYLYARPAATNRPPTASVLLNGRQARPGSVVRLKRTQSLVADASRSRDPDGDRRLAPLWHLDDGRGRRGDRLTLRFDRDARHTLQLTLRDARGAATTQTFTVLVGNALLTGPATPTPRSGAKPSSGCGGCQARANAAGTLALACLCLGALLILVGGRRRRD
ncbi:MAG: metallophosphoesterase [bacterium]